MVKRLSDLLNDSETLSELEPEDLAELILEDLIDREKTINSDFH